MASWGPKAGTGARAVVRTAGPAVSGEQLSFLKMTCSRRSLLLRRRHLK
jgi:hypothetical protein